MKQAKNAKPLSIQPDPYKVQRLSVAGFAKFAHTMTAMPTGWEAALRLGFDCREGRTVLRERCGRGPLVVQKPLYPEGGVCHIYLIHPPGGVVGGDRLRLEMGLGARAQVLLTTPGATKFYRSTGDLAVQQQSLRIGDEGALEWLPQDTILFTGSAVKMTTKVHLAARARFIGWDLTCLGRPAAGDHYVTGHLDQRYQIWRGAEPLLLERNLYQAGYKAGYQAGGYQAGDAHGGDDPLQAAWGLAGNSVVATLYALPATADMVALVRDDLAQDRKLCEDMRCEDLRFGVTRLNDVLVFRCAGRSAERCRGLLVRVWRLLREPILQRAACMPRIWHT